jgi:uncharacterized membrane protein
MRPDSFLDGGIEAPQFHMILYLGTMNDHLFFGLLALLLCALLVWLCRIPLRWWAITSDNVNVKQIARGITVSIVSLLLFVCVFAALSGR